MNLKDKQVVWGKLKGKPNASMQEKSGFGYLSVLEVGMSMHIIGDYDVSTTTVQSVEDDGEAITVKTKNSTYLVRAA